MKRTALVLLAVLLVLSACEGAIYGSRSKVTIDDGNEFTVPYVFYVAAYYFNDSGAFCYKEKPDDTGYSCYHKASNESITAEVVEE